MPMTANQARILLDRVANEAPDRWPAAVQTILVGTLESLDQLANALAALLEGAQPAAPAVGEAPAVAQDAPPVDPDEADRRANLSPEELEREAMMDAAIAASESEKAPAPKRGRKPAAP